MQKAFVRFLAAWLCVVLASAPALANKRAKQLGDAMQAYAAAVRWGEFEQAQQFLEPAYRQAHPLNDMQRRRYAQLEISGYADQGTAQTADGDIVRNIELRVINKHTQGERIVHYVERWHYDAASHRWWVVSGLPDLWNGE